MQRLLWGAEWIGGICLGTLNREQDWLTGRIQASRLLRHAVVVTEKDAKISFYALPLPSSP